MLAHLRNGDTYTRLAKGFAVGTTTVWRYVREAVDLLAAQAPTLTAALWRLAYNGHALGILDGTVAPIDRLSGPQDRRSYSGKHRHHGVNLQALVDPRRGELVWISLGLPGSTHDLTAARMHRIITAATAPGWSCWQTRDIRVLAARYGAGWVYAGPPHPRSSTGRRRAAGVEAATSTVSGLWSAPVTPPMIASVVVRARSFRQTRRPGAYRPSRRFATTPSMPSAANVRIHSTSGTPSTRSSSTASSRPGHV